MHLFLTALHFIWKQNINAKTLERAALTTSFSLFTPSSPLSWSVPAKLHNLEIALQNWEQTVNLSFFRTLKSISAHTHTHTHTHTKNPEASRASETTSQVRKLSWRFLKGGKDRARPAERNESKRNTTTLNAHTERKKKKTNWMLHQKTHNQTHTHTHTHHIQSESERGRERGGKKRERRLCLTLQRCSKNSSLAPWPPAWLSWRQNHRRYK